MLPESTVGATPDFVHIYITSITREYLPCAAVHTRIRHIHTHAPQVLSFESAAACRLVAEHVEEQREAVVAARTVGLVEMLRMTASLAMSNKLDASDCVQ